LASNAAGTSTASRTATSSGRLALIAFSKLVGRNPRRAEEIDDLPDRMNAGVGPARWR